MTNTYTYENNSNNNDFMSAFDFREESIFGSDSSEPEPPSHSSPKKNDDYRGSDAFNHFFNSSSGSLNTQNKLSQTEDASGCGYTILIAEDEILNFQILKMLLNVVFESDCKIIHAKNGQEAIEICKNKENIDLILMDIKMPLVTGLEATKEIKKMYPEIPVVAQTAFSSEDDKESAADAGCNDFITKPIESETLRNVLTKFLQP